LECHYYIPPTLSAGEEVACSSHVNPRVFVAMDATCGGIKVSDNPVVYTNKDMLCYLFVYMYQMQYITGNVICTFTCISRGAHV